MPVSRGPLGMPGSPARPPNLLPAGGVTARRAGSPLYTPLCAPFLACPGFAVPSSGAPEPGGPARVTTSQDPSRPGCRDNLSTCVVQPAGQSAPTAPPRDRPHRQIRQNAAEQGACTPVSPCLCEALDGRSAAHHDGLAYVRTSGAALQRSRWQIRARWSDGVIASAAGRSSPPGDAHPAGVLEASGRVGNGCTHVAGTHGPGLRTSGPSIWTSARRHPGQQGGAHVVGSERPMAFVEPGRRHRRSAGLTPVERQSN